jgi:hypothetical protein
MCSVVQLEVSLIFCIENEYFVCVKALSATALVYICCTVLPSEETYREAL